MLVFLPFLPNLLHAGDAGDGVLLLLRGESGGGRDARAGSQSPSPRNGNEEFQI